MRNAHGALVHLFEFVISCPLDRAVLFAALLGLAASRSATVSEGALLVYDAIWAMLLAWPVRGDRPSLTGFAALVLGNAGLAALLGGVEITAANGKVPGITLALAAAVLFAFGTVIFRSPLPLPTLTLTAWQVGHGCVPIVVLGAIFEAPDLHALTKSGWAAMLYMASVPMGICC